MIDAIAYTFQTGTQWVHLPEKYGNWRGIYSRLRLWAVDSTWEREFTALVAQADADEDLNRVVSVDSTIVRAHQHAAGARKRGPLPTGPTGQHTCLLGVSLPRDPRALAQARHPGSDPRPR